MSSNRFVGIWAPWHQSSLGSSLQAGSDQGSKQHILQNKIGEPEPNTHQRLSTQEDTCTYYSGRHLYCQCNQRTQLTCTSCCCDDTPPPPPYSMLMRVDRVGHEVNKYCQSTLNPGGSGGQLENKLAMHTCTSTSLPVMYWQYFFHAPITPWRWNTLSNRQLRFGL